MNSRGPLDWTDDEFQKLLEAAENLAVVKLGDCGAGMYRFRPHPKSKAKTCQRRDWWIAYLYVARETGLPWKVLRRLDASDVSSKGILTARLRAPNELRSIKLSQESKAALDALPKGRGSLLGLRIDYPALQSRWRKLCIAAELFKPQAANDVVPLRFSQSIKPDLRRGAIVNPEGITSESKADDFFESVYFKLRLGSRSPRTVDLYRRTLKLFSETLGRPARLTDFNDDAVEAHLHSLTMRKVRKLAPHTVEKERQQLLAIWRFACQRRLVELYPTVQPRKLPEKTPLGWTTNDLTRLFEAARNTEGKIGKAPAGVWWYALLLVLYDTAERITAIMQIEWSNVDLDGGWLTVPAEHRKGKTRDVVSRLHPDTVQALRELLSYGKVTERVFPRGRGGSHLWYLYSKILAKAGLPNDAKSKFHRIRRTAASYYERAGCDATSLLDHSSRKVTKKYLDPRIVERKHASDVLPRPTVSDKKGGAQ